MVVEKLGEIEVLVLDQFPVMVGFEKFLVGPPVTDTDEFIDCHVKLTKNIFQRFAKVAPWEFAVVAANEV